MTGGTVTLAGTSDGAPIGALMLSAMGTRRGAIILLQEIFGIDANMAADAGRWAEAGFDVIAPSLFDRVEPNFTAHHSPEGIAKGFAAMQSTPDQQAIGDIAACVLWAEERGVGPIFIVGYCLGGRLAWRAAAALKGIAGAAVYYGDVLRHIDETPACPVICHFGGRDMHLPVAEIAAAMPVRHPAIPVHVYTGSGHGFNNAGAPDADPRDAEAARTLTRAFFETSCTRLP